jgi:hypothetical protein
MTAAAGKGRVQPRSSQTPPRWRSFVRGFRQRSPLVLLAAAALALCGVLALQHAVVSGGLTAVSEGRLLRITHDDYVHVAYRVAELKKHPPQGRTVYLFGGSGTMESFSSEDELAAAISREAGQEVGVVSLAAHAQSFAQNLVLVDNLPQGQALLAIGLAPMRFNQFPEDDIKLLSGRTLLMRSPRLESLAGALYGSEAPFTGALPGIFDYVSSYLQARPKGEALWGVRLPYEKHYYALDADPAPTSAKRATLAQELALSSGRYRRNSAYNFVVLEELLRLARDRGLQVVLFEQPLNTDIAGRDWAGVLPDYRRRVRALARGYDVPYLHFQHAVGLRNADFADLYHLIGDGRLRWQRELARSLAAVLGAQGGLAALQGPPWAAPTSDPGQGAD